MPRQIKAKRVKPVVGGIISGGLSSRMGRPKEQIILPDGRSMIQTVMDALLAICNEIVIAGPEAPLQLVEDERVHFVKDNFPGAGPLAGVESILSTGLANGYIIVACDQPLLTADLLKSLVPDNRRMPCFFDLEDEGYIQPFPGYYPVSWLPDIRDSLRRNHRALKTLIASSQVIMKPIEAADVKLLQSINTEEELSRLTSFSG